MLPCSIGTCFLGLTLLGCSVDDPLVRLLLSRLGTNEICPILARYLICFLIPCLGSTCSLYSSIYVFICTSLRLPFRAPTCSRVYPQIWPEKTEGIVGRSVTHRCYDDRHGHPSLARCCHLTSDLGFAITVPGIDGGSTAVMWVRDVRDGALLLRPPCLDRMVLIWWTTDSGGHALLLLGEKTPDGGWI
ncbi:hypothetical protein ACLOJK_038856 [Asimina triloba]